MVKAITYIIKNDSTAAALIGNNTAVSTKKVYPVTAPQGESFPLVTVWETSRIPSFCKGRRSQDFEYTYEVHVYSLDYDAMNAICEAVNDALEDADVSSAINGVTFTDRIRNINRRDAGWIDTYKAYSKVLTFQSTTHEDQPT